MPNAVVEVISLADYDGINELFFAGIDFGEPRQNRAKQSSSDLTTKADIIGHSYVGQMTDGIPFGKASDIQHGLQEIEGFPFVFLYGFLIYVNSGSCICM